MENKNMYKWIISQPFLESSPASMKILSCLETNMQKEKEAKFITQIIYSALDISSWEAENTILTKPFLHWNIISRIWKYQLFVWVSSEAIGDSN